MVSLADTAKSTVQREPPLRALCVRYRTVKLQSVNVVIAMWSNLTCTLIILSARSDGTLDGSNRGQIPQTRVLRRSLHGTDFVRATYRPPANLQPQPQIPAAVSAGC